MKNFLLLFFLMTILLLFTGCPDSNPSDPTPTGEPEPSPAPTPYSGNTTVTGTIRDQSGAGISGMTVTIAGQATTTGAGGGFSFLEISSGAASLYAEGGDDAHYLAEKSGILITTGVNDLGTITAYQIQGAGIIIESLSGKSIQETASLLSPGFKVFDITQRVPVNSPLTEPSGDMAEKVIDKAVPTYVLLDNISFVQINWGSLNDAWVTFYTVTYLGESGSLLPSGQEIWDSRDSHPEDGGPFDPDNPRALLDVSVELAGYITEPGLYCFTITGHDTGVTQAITLPVITVSLGIELSGLPENLSATPDTTTLITWDSVVGADWYYVTLMKEDAPDPEVYRSDELYISEDSVPDILDNGTYYLYYVDAHSADGTGYTGEITRGISGFVR